MLWIINVALLYECLVGQPEMLSVSLHLDVSCFENTSVVFSSSVCPHLLSSGSHRGLGTVTWPGLLKRGQAVLCSHKRGRCFPW